MDRQGHRCKPLKQLILDLDSSVSETYGKQQGTTIWSHHARRAGTAELEIFDCEHKTMRSASSTLDTSTIVAIRAQGTQLPIFRLRTKRFGDKIFGAGSEIFSETHVLMCDDAGASQLVSDEAWSFLAQHPDLSVEGGGDAIIVYRDCKRFGAKQLPALLKQALRVFELLTELDSRIPA